MNALLLAYGSGLFFQSYIRVVLFTTAIYELFVSYVQSGVVVSGYVLEGL